MTASRARAVPPQQAAPTRFTLLNDAVTGDWKQDVDRPPLGSLTSMLLRAVVDRMLDKAAAAGGTPLRPSHLYLLRSLYPDGASVTELAELNDVTKQAVTQVLDTLESRGLVRRLPDPRDGRGKIVRLTRRGEKELSIAVQAYGEVENEWAELIGGHSEMQRVREAIFAFIEAYGDWHRGEKPRNRVVW